MIRARDNSAAAASRTKRVKRGKPADEKRVVVVCGFSHSKGQWKRHCALNSRLTVRGKYLVVNCCLKGHGVLARNVTTAL